MTKLFQNMVANSLAAKTISLTPDVGQSILVTDICVVPNSAVGEFLTAQVSQTTVGFYHVGSGILNQLPFQDGNTPQGTIFAQMAKRGYDMSIPVAEGETFTVSADNNWSYLVVKYDIYTAGDIKNTDRNGSRSSEYIFLNYGTHDTAITTASNFVLNKTHNPVEFPDFPYGSYVPAKSTISVLGVGFPAQVMEGTTAGTDSILTEYLKFTRDREVLFDDDRNGFLVLGIADASHADSTMFYESERSNLPYGGEDQYSGIYLFNNPLVFTGGEELTLTVSTLLAGGGSTLVASGLYSCIPMLVQRGNAGGI